MKVCYVLCYYFPRYVRTQTLLDGLNQIPYLSIGVLINKNKGWLRYFEILLRLLIIRLCQKPDFFILGFRGYEIYWPIRLLTWGRPLILDHMMSPYDSLVYEKQKVTPGSIVEQLIYYYERMLLQNATAILTDTSNHKHYLANLFQVNPQKIYPVHVGTDEDLFKPLPFTKPDHNYFEVFFYGSFLPLHGVSYILQAAHLLQELPIKFHLVGGHKTDLKKFANQIKELELSNVVHTPWIEYEQLPTVIAAADLCLGGPFGNTGQAQRIITGKTYQFLAMNKPTVLGMIKPDQGFIDRHNCLLVPQADEQALAEAIHWAYTHQRELPDIARRGHRLYWERFSTLQISQTLKNIFDEILSA